MGFSIIDACTIDCNEEFDDDFDNFGGTDLVDGYEGSDCGDSYGGDVSPKQTDVTIGSGTGKLSRNFPSGSNTSTLEP